MRKLFTAFLLFACLTGAAQTSCDIVIRNGRIIDGTGNSWFYGDVAVSGGKIIAVGKLPDYTAPKIIDANKMIIAPGFIDVHGHVESGIFQWPTADNYIYDGVTTVITGNCGGSASNLKNFFRRIDSLHPSINIASLVGHNTVREKIMNRDNRLPSSTEQHQMDSLVEEAMKDRAGGSSTG
jgi:N-acyl-D-amino-acid deacylase